MNGFEFIRMNVLLQLLGANVGLASPV